MSVHLIISFRIRPERLAPFTELLEGVKASLPAVPGCTGVQVFQAVDDPLAFTLVEAWQNADLHGRHVQAMQESGQWAAVAQHLSADPVSAWFHPLRQAPATV